MGDSLLDTDIRAEHEFTKFERRMVERERELEEPEIKIGIEVERVIEEMGVGNKEPRFGDGTRAFCFSVKESIARKLYEDLDEKFGENSNP